MQHARNCILQHARLRCHAWPILFKQDGLIFGGIGRNLCASTSSTSDKLLDRVIGLVKKVGNIDASKVSEKADFQKDLSLDSLDKVELVMAFEQEFSIEIPDEEADKLTCCADVVRYIESEAIHNKEDKP